MRAASLTHPLPRIAAEKSASDPHLAMASAFGSTAATISLARPKCCEASSASMLVRRAQSIQLTPSSPLPCAEPWPSVDVRPSSAALNDVGVSNGKAGVSRVSVVGVGVGVHQGGWAHLYLRTVPRSALTRQNSAFSSSSWRHPMKSSPTGSARTSCHALAMSGKPIK